MSVLWLYSQDAFDTCNNINQFFSNEGFVKFVAFYHIHRFVFEKKMIGALYNVNTWLKDKYVKKYNKVHMEFSSHSYAMLFMMVISELLYISYMKDSIHA